MQACYSRRPNDARQAVLWPARGSGRAYLWVVVFFLAPMALIAKISLSHPAQARPPYEPVFSLSDGLAGSLAKLQTLSLDAYRTFGEDRLYLDSYLTSLAIAGVSTALMLLVAYPSLWRWRAPHAVCGRS